MSVDSSLRTLSLAELERDVQFHKSMAQKHRRIARAKVERIKQVKALLATVGVNVVNAEDGGNCHGSQDPESQHN